MDKRDAYDTYENIGIKSDMYDMVYNVGADSTPFMSRMIEVISTDFGDYRVIDTPSQFSSLYMAGVKRKANNGSLDMRYKASRLAAKALSQIHKWSALKYEAEHG